MSDDAMGQVTFVSLHVITFIHNSINYASQNEQQAKPFQSTDTSENTKYNDFCKEIQLLILLWS